MKKLEFITEVAKKMKSQTAAEAAVNGVFDTITALLAKNEDVQITGFGKFITQDKSARTGRNPKTGEAVDIPAKTVAKFVPGATLKKAVK